MQNAQILVVNHALFFTDLALRREKVSILPKYDVVILDEAHTMEASRRRPPGPEHHQRPESNTPCGKLYNDRTNRGLLVHHKLRDAQKEVWECRERSTLFSRASPAGCDEQPAGQPAACRQPNIVANSLSEGLRKLVATLRRHAKQIERAESVKISPRRRTGSTRWPRASKIGAASRFPTRSIGSNASFGRRRLRITLAAAPIDVGPALREHLFSANADGDHDQRHVGHAAAARKSRRSTSFNRGSGYCRRKRCGWAARSTTAARPN